MSLSVSASPSRFDRERSWDHDPGFHRPPCALCEGDGEVVNPGNASPRVKVTDWLRPVPCPRCQGTGKDPNP